MTPQDFAAIFGPVGASGVPGWCTAEKAAHLYGLAARLAADRPRPPVAVEIGVWGGRSLIPVALAFRDAGRGFVLGIDSFTAAAAVEAEADPANVDWWGSAQLDYEAHWLACCRLIARFDLARHCAVLRARSEDAAPVLAGIDYLHIDGNHSVAVSLRDTGLYLPLVRTGGFVVLDDANWGTVREARARVAERCRLVHAAEQGAWEVWER